jgi:toxin ParE1/3/4
VYEPLERRLQLIEARIGAWPKSAPEVDERPDVRVVPLVRYPYKNILPIGNDAVEILHIHRAARRAPWDER